MTRILVIANEPVWPANGGGRVRMAGLIEALSGEFETAVVQPSADEEDWAVSPPSVRVSPVPVRRSHPSVADFLHWQPRLGRAVVQPAMQAEVRRLVSELRPRVMLFTHSYLAAVMRSPDVIRVVDFPNVEIARMRSFAERRRGVQRWSAVVEHLKARAWEPRVARGSDVAVAVSAEEAATIGRWAERVVVVPNAGRGPKDWSESPEDGPVTYLAGAAYDPNRQAAKFLVEEVWPLVRAILPAATLHLVGRGMDEVMGWAGDIAGVTVSGEVPDVAPMFHKAAVVAAPVNSGAGTQLKVVDALTHGRVIVATPYSARSVPPGAEIACDVASDAHDFALALVKALINVHERHRRERQLRLQWEPLSWSSAATPLISALRSDLREAT